MDKKQLKRDYAFLIAEVAFFFALYVISPILYAQQGRDIPFPLWWTLPGWFFSVGATIVDIVKNKKNMEPAQEEQQKFLTY